MTHGYHGYQWIQEIPVRHEQPSRGRHVNQGGETDPHDDEHSIASFTNANRQNILAHYGTAQRAGRLRLMRNPDASETLINSNSSSKTTSQPMKNPVVLQQKRSAPRGQLILPPLKTWESTGSLVENPSPTYENVRMERSFSHPRTTQTSGQSQFHQPVLRNIANNRSVAKQMSIMPVTSPIKIGSRDQNRQGSVSKITHASPFHHPFFYTNDTKDTGYSAQPPAQISTTKNMQENIRWPNTEEKPGSQYDNESDFFTTPNQKHVQPVDSNSSALPALNTTQRNVISKPPLQFKRSVPKQAVEKTDNVKTYTPAIQPERHFGTQRRQHVIVDRPVDDNVVYTEVRPDMFKRNSRTSERANAKMRSRSPSPVIYAEIDHTDNHERLRKFPTQNDHRHVKKVMPSSSNEQHIPLAKEEIDSLRLSTWKHPNRRQTLVDRQDSHSQTPSEYSISLGTPRLELRRMKKTHDNNNNLIREKHSRENDKTKPFPDSSSLEQMLSDSSSSKKSGTIKSVLKAPSDKFPNTGNARGLQRSPKRVTIKEQESQFSSDMHPVFKGNPQRGFNRPPTRTHHQEPPTYRIPDHHFKVINRRVVRAA